MEVNSVGPSCISNDSCQNENTQEMIWDSEITQEKVEDTLMKFFYPFKEVKVTMIESWTLQLFLPLVMQFYTLL